MKSKNVSSENNSLVAIKTCERKDGKNVCFRERSKTECDIMGARRAKQMLVNITDGGRAAAGFKKASGDCVVRAIAIATRLPYREVYEAIDDICERARPSRGKKSQPDKGVFKKDWRKLLEKLGWKWTATMGIGTGCKIHLRDGELPMGRLIVQVTRHVVAVIDGVIHDNHDCSRDGMRCVYGYWSKA